ncbi:MAG TPA: ABC transporter permease [Ktedonobacterales bacterium]
MGAAATYTDSRISLGATTAKPSFLGLVRGELFKISRQRITWFMLLVLAGLVCFPYVIGLGRGGIKDYITQAPLDVIYRDMAQGFFVLRVFSGAFLVLVTARLIGMEYSGGTIRVLLSRGVGRMQLLSAKLLTLALVALGVFAGGAILDLAMTVASVQLVAGNLDALKSIDATFWSDTRIMGMTVLISMGVTILMAAAVTTVARSLAGGMSAGLAWFPADNIGLIIFYLAFSLTKSDFWTLVTGDFLGPNINVMAARLMSAHAQALQIGFDKMSPPLVPVTGGHTLLVTAIYAVVFLVVAFGLTGWRDVTE